MSNSVSYLFPSEIILDESYRMISKRNPNEFVARAVIRSEKKVYFFKYFSTKYSERDIAEYMWSSFFKQFPNAETAFKNGTSTLYLTFDSRSSL